MSEPQTPTAATRSSTSPLAALGFGTFSRRMSPGEYITAARMV
jgi:hypothetical protein